MDIEKLDKNNINESTESTRTAELLVEIKKDVDTSEELESMANLTDSSIERDSQDAKATINQQFVLAAEEIQMSRQEANKVAQEIGVTDKRRELETSIDKATKIARDEIQSAMTLHETANDAHIETRDRQSRAKEQLKVVMEEWPRPNIGPHMEQISKQLRDLTLFGDREYCFSVGKKDDGSIITLTGIAEGIQLEVPPEVLRSQDALKQRAAKSLQCQEIINIHTHPQEKALKLADEEHDALFAEQIRRERSSELPPSPHPPSGADIHGGLTKFAEQLIRTQHNLGGIPESRQFIADSAGVWEVSFENDSPIHTIMSQVAEDAWKKAEVEKEHSIQLAKEGIDLLSPPGMEIKKGASDAELESWWQTIGRIECAKKEASTMFSEANWKSYINKNQGDPKLKSIDINQLFQHGTIGNFPNFGYAYSKQAMQELLIGNALLQEEERKAQIQILENEMRWKKSLGIVVEHHPFQK